MNDNAIKRMIQQHEGYKDHVYLDTEGNPTCGWGHYLSVGSKVPPAVAQAFFEADYMAAELDYVAFEYEFTISLNSVRRAVLIDMFFNMGRDRVYGFEKMIKALQNEDYETAAVELVDSKWYRQTKTRAVELVAMMREG